MKVAMGGVALTVVLLVSTLGLSLTSAGQFTDLGDSETAGVIGGKVKPGCTTTSLVQGCRGRVFPNGDVCPATFRLKATPTGFFFFKLQAPVACVTPGNLLCGGLDDVDPQSCVPFPQQ